MDGFEKNTNEFTNPDMGSEENFAIALLKGILGAVVGAIPGFLLWIIIAKLGYVSSLCGAVIAIGSAFGFSFMTKKSSISPVIAIITCIIVMAIAVYMAIRIDWAWEIAKYFEESVWPEYIAYMSDFGFTASESTELYEEYLMEELGFSEPNFTNCFSKLNSLIEYFDMKTDFILEIVKGGACALLGVGVLFAKLKK